MWNEALASGQPFPVKKVPIQVWSLGRFKFKGIADTCKVNVITACAMPLMAYIECLCSKEKTGEVNNEAPQQKPECTEAADGHAMGRLQ